MIPKNIFEHLEFPTGEKEKFQALLQEKNIKIERILSSGQRSPHTGWHDQEKDEWVLLLSGKAGIEFEGQKLMHLKKGDHLHIKAHLKHRVVYTSKRPPCIWLAIHF
ncbi:MAG: cupin domain-containing protein [Bacteroidota bacterium]